MLHLSYRFTLYLLCPYHYAIAIFNNYVTGCGTTFGRSLRRTLVQQYLYGLFKKLPCCVYHLSTVVYTIKHR